MTDLSIVICTYDRPASLEATLKSCLAQTNALGLSIEIVVVDNHPSGSARAVVERLAQSARWPMRYVTELTRNMSTLRNRGFAEARGRLAALIDDDEVAEPDWLDQLVGALRAADADMAVGPRHAIFAGEPPPYDPKGSQFVRIFDLPDGAIIPLTAPSGKPRFGMGTGNSLFDLSRCFPNGEPAMREAFGDAGGEDAELFIRLYREGRRIVWAARAVVTETVAPHRTAVTYRLIRARREAQHYVSIYLDVTPHPRLTWATLMAKGLAQVIVGFVLSALTFEFGSQRRLRGRALMEHGIGKLLWKQAVGYIAEPSLNRAT